MKECGKVRSAQHKASAIFYRQYSSQSNYSNAEASSMTCLRQKFSPFARPTFRVEHPSPHYPFLVRQLLPASSASCWLWDPQVPSRRTSFSLLQLALLHPRTIQSYALWLLLLPYRGFPWHIVTSFGSLRTRSRDQLDKGNLLLALSFLVHALGTTASTIGFWVLFLH